MMKAAAEVFRLRLQREPGKWSSFCGEEKNKIGSIDYTKSFTFVLQWIARRKFTDECFDSLSSIFLSSPCPVGDNKAVKAADFRRIGFENTEYRADPNLCGTCMCPDHPPTFKFVPRGLRKLANTIKALKLDTEDVCGMTAGYLFLYEHLHLPAIIVAGCFVFVALVLSIILIFQHLRSYNNPAEQKWIVVIIFMVPAYATESILSLLNSELSLACDILRSCYEAFALYAFGSYLIACLGGEPRVIELLDDEARKQIIKPLLEGKKDPRLKQRKFVSFFFHPCLLGKDLFPIIKFGLVQYMILKTLCAFLAFLLELCGVYGDGKFKWYYGYPYITVVLNFSQMWALYCLVQFYNVTHEKLEPIRPLAKFISFKAIVFATWWQGVGIVLLCTLQVLPNSDKLQTGLQDFLICLEMAIAAVAHIFVFSAKPYHIVPPSHYGKITTEETKEVLDIGDGNEVKPALLEKKETKVEAPGTSVKESVQDIVVGGGHKVVEDVVLTINQAIEPVHEGVTKIQEKFHHISVSDGKKEPGVKVAEHKRNVTKMPEM